MYTIQTAFSALDYYLDDGHEIENPAFSWISTRDDITLKITHDCCVTHITIGDKLHVVRDVNTEIMYTMEKGTEQELIDYVTELIPPSNIWDHTCENCSKRNATVQMIYDPFQQEMNNRDVLLAVLCKDCFSKDYDLQDKLHNSAMEV